MRLGVDEPLVPLPKMFGGPPDVQLLFCPHDDVCAV
jgi:hypothetical protein